MEHGSSYTFCQQLNCNRYSETEFQLFHSLSQRDAVCNKEHRTVCLCSFLNCFLFHKDLENPLSETYSLGSTVNRLSHQPSYLFHSLKYPRHSGTLFPSAHPFALKC